MVETTKRGEFRKLTPEEFGNMVTMFRKALDWKQINLAHEAGIDERTIQRTEAGHPVSDETRRRIAKAFKLPEDEFLKPSYVPTDEEVRTRISEVSEKFVLVEARRLKSPRDLEEILSVGHAFLIDGTQLPDDMQQEVAAFKDAFHDWTWIYSDINHVQRLEACASLLKDVVRISGNDFHALFATYDSEKPSGFKVVAITFVHNDREITQLVLPRHLENLQF